MLVALLVCWFGRFVKERSIVDDVRELPSKKSSAPEAVSGEESQPRVICAATCHSSLVITDHRREQGTERKGAQRNDEGHAADPHRPRDLRLHVMREFRVDLQDCCSVAILRELLDFEILVKLLGQNGHLLLLHQLSNVRREVVQDRAAGSAYGPLRVAPPTLLPGSTLGTGSRWSGRVKDDQHAEKAVAVQ